MTVRLVGGWSELHEVIHTRARRSAQGPGPGPGRARATGAIRLFAPPGKRTDRVSVLPRGGLLALLRSEERTVNPPATLRLREKGGRGRCPLAGQPAALAQRETGRAGDQAGGGNGEGLRVGVRCAWGASRTHRLAVMLRASPSSRLPPPPSPTSPPPTPSLRPGAS